MSGLLAGKVWQSALAPELKPLAAALADIASDDGTSIYPSVEYIGWLLGKTRRSVQMGLARLRKAEVLLVIGNGKGGRSLSTEYRLIEANLPAREPWKNSASVAPFLARNSAFCDTKGRILRHKRAQPIAPDPLLSVNNKTGVNAKSRKSSPACGRCLGAGYIESERGLKRCSECSPGAGEKRKQA